MNNVNLIGRLVRDPELRFIAGSGTAVANFTLAVDKGLSKAKKEEFESKGQSTVDFIQVVVWNKSAENCANFLSKGRLCAVNGSIETGSYNKTDGSTVYTTKVRAFNVEFLEWGDKKEEGTNVDPNVPMDFQAIEDDSEDIPF